MTIILHNHNDEGSLALSMGNDVVNVDDDYSLGTLTIGQNRNETNSHNCNNKNNNIGNKHVYFICWQRGQSVFFAGINNYNLHSWKENAVNDDDDMTDWVLLWNERWCSWSSFIYNFHKMYKNVYLNNKTNNRPKSYQKATAITFHTFYGATALSEIHWIRPSIHPFVCPSVHLSDCSLLLSHFVIYELKMFNWGKCISQIWVAAITKRSLFPVQLIFKK